MDHRTTPKPGEQKEEPATWDPAGPPGGEDDPARAGATPPKPPESPPAGPPPDPPPADTAPRSPASPEALAEVFKGVLDE